MRKKVGEIRLTDKQENEEYQVTIWGSVFKTDDGKTLGGIHFNIYKGSIDVYYPFVQQVLQMCDGMKFKYVVDQYGTRYRASYYGNLKDFDCNIILERLKNVQSYEDDRFIFELNITKDYDFVLESKMIRDL